MNGDGRTKFLDGAIHGINLAATLRRAKSFRLDSSDREMQKTDFAELSGTYVIRDGIIENGDLKMLAPLIRLTGEGQVSLPPQDLDYKLTARLVPTLQGQGGEDALAGLPIPISITGLWVAPKYAIDWESVFREAAKDPARWKSMPKDLRRMSGNMGIGLPEGAAPVTDRLKGLVGSGVGAAGRAPTGASKPPTTAKDQPKQSPSSSGGILPNPLKGLLGK
jgi:AsmA protein